jgi:hypothetical protein
MKGATVIGPGIVCGSYPKTAADVRFLHEKLNVVCILNTCTPEEREEQEQYHSYSKWLAENSMTAILLPWPGGTTLTTKPPALAEIYKDYVQKAHKLTSRADVLYVHGIEGDGICAMGLFLRRSPHSAPADPVAYLQADDRLAHLIDNDLEKKETLTRLFKDMRAPGSIRHYFPVQKKKKDEMEEN